MKDINTLALVKHGSGVEDNVDIRAYTIIVGAIYKIKRIVVHPVEINCNKSRAPKDIMRLISRVVRL